MLPNQPVVLNGGLHGGSEAGKRRQRVIPHQGWPAGYLLVAEQVGGMVNVK